MSRRNGPSRQRQNGSYLKHEIGSVLDPALNNWQEGKEMVKLMVRLINRLIKWLKAHGFGNGEIVDCIEFITEDSKQNKQ